MKTTLFLLLFSTFCSAQSLEDFYFKQETENLLKDSIINNKNYQNKEIKELSSEIENNYKILNKKPEKLEIYLSQNYVPNINTVDILNNYKNKKIASKKDLPTLIIPDLKKK